ncbi:MAG: hypothetical protein IT290_11400 [Deltaproteobacteria bacterium]|nr:hypothetical protein [Deltaproteobacteria bacterium]
MRAPTIRLTGPELTLYVLIAALFWLLRTWYWDITSEEVFSDMSDFQYMANCIVHHFCFWWNDFFQTYSPPTVAVLRATQMVLFGESMLAWRIFSATILFSGVVWLALEIRHLRFGRVLGPLLFASVALSKPSIFWSLKLSREGVGEAFTYLTIAGILFALRNRNAWSAMLAGGVMIAGVLVRGSAAPLVILIPLYLLLDGRSSNPARRRATLAGWFLFGMMLVWSPWLIRSYRLYGAVVPLSTQAPYAFFWDLGFVTITLEDGSTITTSAATLQDEAPKNFANDYEASVYANRLVRLWIAEHGAKLPAIMWNRLLHTVSEREVHLTQVPRDRLLPEPVNFALIDKSELFVALGLVGYLFALALSPRYLLFLLAATVPWVNAGILVGYGRMLEPSLTVILFGNVAGLAGLIALVRRRSASTAKVDLN